MSINNVISYRLKIPIIGRIIKRIVNNKVEKEKNPNPQIAEGHFGQVIPLEEAKVIVSDLADVNTKVICPCRYMYRGIRVDNCLGLVLLQKSFPSFLV